MAVSSPSPLPGETDFSPYSQRHSDLCKRRDAAAMTLIKTVRLGYAIRKQKKKPAKGRLRGKAMATAYDTDLDRNAANFQPLTPLSFLARAAAVYPDQTAIIHGKRSWTYREFFARAKKLASALVKRGIKRGDTVAVVLPNVPAMLEAHYGVAMAGAVLNTINTRLDAAIIAFTLDHGEAKVLLADREFSKVVKDALARCKAQPLVVDYDDPEYTGAGERFGNLDYEDLLREGDPDFSWLM